MFFKDNKFLNVASGSFGSCIKFSFFGLMIKSVFVTSTRFLTLKETNFCRFYIY